MLKANTPLNKLNDDRLIMNMAKTHYNEDWKAKNIHKVKWPEIQRAMFIEMTWRPSATTQAAAWALGIAGPEFKGRDSIGPRTLKAINELTTHTERQSFINKFKQYMLEYIQRIDSPDKKGYIRRLNIATTP